MEDMINKNIAELVFRDDEYAYDLQKYLNAKISTKAHVRKDYESYLRRYNLVSSYLYLNQTIDALGENTLFDENKFLLMFTTDELKIKLVEIYQFLLTNDLTEHCKIMNCYRIRSIRSYLELLSLIDWV